MIIKLKRVISCSSEHPSHQASNLLDHHLNNSWRCANPGEMLATVILEMSEPSCITGLDIGNYRSCVVIVEASTSKEPDKWIPIVNHQFLSNDEAANGKFRDQVQLFTKKELNPDNVKIKFDRIKVTCMQSANPRELFGLVFIIFKTEVTVDLEIDVFGRFKLKEEKSNVDEFKEKYLKMFGKRHSSYKDDLKAKVKDSGMESFTKRQEEVKEPMKRPMLDKLEVGKADEVFGKQDLRTLHNSTTPIIYTPFGDVVPSPKKTESKKIIKKNNVDITKASTSKKYSNSEDESLRDVTPVKKARCSKCKENTEDKLCQHCGELVPQKENLMQKNIISKPKKAVKEFGKLFEGITFSLSGYVNPQRDSIRRKALQMGAKYIADPNITNNKCTHLICAFKNTPKYQQLKGHSKIVLHTFIEDSFDKKTRFPWRRYALDKSDKMEPESEEEIDVSLSTNPYEMDTDEDSDPNY